MKNSIQIHWFKRPSAHLTNVLLAATVLMVAGCANHSKRHFTVGSVPSNYKTKHPIVIDEQEQTLDIPVGSSSYDLPLASASAVEGFADRYRRSANGVVTVMIPSGSPNEAAARTVALKVVDTLRKSGLPNERVRLASYHATDHGPTAPIRLSYHGIKASVKGCGQWPEDLAGAGNTENQNYHNFGCASQNNLASIIANPADLLGPRGMSDIDAGRRAVAIDDFRENGQSLQGTPSTLYTR